MILYFFNRAQAPWTCYATVYGYVPMLYQRSSVHAPTCMRGCDIIYVFDIIVHNFMFESLELSNLYFLIKLSFHLIITPINYLSESDTMHILYYIISYYDDTSTATFCRTSAVGNNGGDRKAQIKEQVYLVCFSLYKLMLL